MKDREIRPSVSSVPRLCDLCVVTLIGALPRNPYPSPNSGGRVPPFPNASTLNSR